MDKFRATEIFNDSRLKLIAIESVVFQRSNTRTSYILNGSIKPIAIIVSYPDGIYALDMEEKLIRIEQLGRDIPELESIIAPFNLTQKSFLG